MSELLKQREAFLKRAQNVPVIENKSAPAPKRARLETSKKKSGTSEELPSDPQDRDAHEESSSAEWAAAAESGRRARGMQLHHHCV